MMKSETQIRNAERKIDTDAHEFHGMTYEEGVEHALAWVLGEMDDEEFPYA